MGNFLEDFIFGRPNPQTGETTGGIPAVADAIWPFEGTAVSSFVDSGVGQAVTLPVRAPLMIGMAGLTALDIAMEYGLYRPVSTALQAGATPGTEMMKRGAPVNPLYRDGVQIQDFIDMWNASEYITPARALHQWSWYQGGNSSRDITNPKMDASAFKMYRALQNPYPTAGGISREEYEAAWDSTLLGTITSGSMDTLLGLVGIPGIGKVATKAKDAAGLQSTIKSARDLTKLRTTMEAHETWRASGGTEGRWNVAGKYLEDLAQETDIDKIISNPMLDRWTRSGSFNRDTLAALIADIDDVPTIRELMLADRGDTLALGRLFYAAPDHVWSLTDMNEKMARQFAEGGQYFPSQDVSRVLGATFDSAVQRDEWWASVRDTFMSGRYDEPMVSPQAAAEEIALLRKERDVLTKTVPDTDGILSQLEPDGIAARIDEIDQRITELEAPTNPEVGLLNAVRGEGSDFVPLGVFGDNAVADAVGSAERWVKSFVADARLNRPNQYVEMALGAKGAKPLTTLLFWTGSRQPLNMVNYTSMRPTEVVDEMMSYSRSSRSLRKGTWTVSRLDEQTGEPLQLQMRDWEWRQQAIDRLVRAKTRGVSQLDQEVDALQGELISVVVNRYGLAPDKAREASQALSTWLNTAQAQVARDGFFVDEVDGMTVLDRPVTMRQLAVSRILMPLDDLDWALRQVSTTSFAKRGRKTRAAMRITANTLDTLFKIFRTNVLFKPGYTPKNSFAEPGVSAVLADGSLLAQDGLANTLKRFEINNDRRLLSLKYGVIDRLPLSAARKDANQAAALANDYATLTAQLDEIDQHIADLAETSPVTQSKYLAAARTERRKLARQMTVLERKLSVVAGDWSDVVEVPTYSELADRAETLRLALLDDAFPETATARISELEGLAASRLDGLEQQVSLTERIAQLQAKRSSLIATRDSMFMRDGRRAAERDLKNPAKNKRRDLQDPENPDARVAPDWIEQLARVNDPRDMTSLSRDPGRNAATRRMEATIRSIDYIDEQIQAAHAALRASRKAGATADELSGLTAVEAEEIRQLQSLLAVRGKMDATEAQTVLESIDQQLDEIRRATQVVSPDAKAKAEALRERLAQLDEQRATLTARIANRTLSRETLAKRELSGETDYVQRIGGVDYTIPAPFRAGDQFGTAMRAEASADISQAQQLSGGVDPLGLDRSRLIGTRWERLDSGATISPVDPRYWGELAYAYNRHVLGDEFAKLLLSGASDADVLKWFNRTEGQNYAKAMGWTRDELTGGPSGSVKARPIDVTSTAKPRITVFESGIIADTRRRLKQYFPDPEVRARLVRGEEVTPGELQAAMGSRSDLSPVYGTGLQLIGNPLARANVALNNVLDIAWRNLASKPESRFGRWPFFTREYNRQMERSVRLRQDQGLPITGTDLIAMKRQASARALKEAENSFYNVRRMTSPVFAMRYLASFASAAWNTVYRYFRLAYRRPGTAMVMAWGWENFLNEMGVNEDGDRVERWQDAKNILVSLPADVDIPIDPSLKISVDTFNFATQDGSYNPVFAIGTSSLLRYKPELEPWLKEKYPEIHNELFSYGTGTSPTFQVGPIVFDPVSSGYQRRLKTLLAGTFGMSDEDFLKSATLDYKYRLFQWAKDGQRGDIPTYEDSAKNARDFYLWNVGISAFASGVTGISPEGEFYRQEWRRIKDKNADNYAAAQAEMFSLYGDPAYFIMDSSSSSRSNMPATPEALDILRANEPLAKQLLEMSVSNPKMTVDLMFLDQMAYKEEDFSQAIYDAQFNMTLPGDDEPIRSRDTEVEVQRQIKSARSWAIWNASVAARDAALMQLGEKTLKETGVTAGLYAQWKQFEADFMSNPDHALMVEEKGLINTGRTEIALRAIDSMLNNRSWMNGVRDSTTWTSIAGYMGELRRAKEQFDLLSTSADKDAFAVQWDAYVRARYLPGAGNFSGYYERYLAGRDLSGQQMLERDLNYPSFPLKEATTP